MMGTLCYSAPEQLSGGEVNTRADIYSLGAILYFLIAGRSPYLDDQRQGNLILQLARPPETIDPTHLGPSRTRAAEVVIHRAMSPSVNDRYASADALYADIERVLSPDDTLSGGRDPSLVDAPTAVRVPAPPTAAPSAATAATAGPAGMTRRRWLLAAGGGGAAAAAAAGLGWWALRRPKGAGATAAGVSTDEILVGMSAPFNGPTAELGRGMLLGIEAVITAINDEGGIHGRRLRLIALDDGYEPAQTKVTMTRLVEQYGVFAFLGNVGTPTAEVALPIALKNERVFFGAFTGANLLRSDPPERLVFNYRPAYAEETEATVKFLLESRRLPPDSIAVFAQRDGYGNAGFAGVARALRKRGVVDASIPRFGYDRNDNNVAAAVDELTKLKERVKAVVMVATYKPAARFILQARKAGSSAIFTNVSFVDSEALAEEFRQFGPKAGVGRDRHPGGAGPAFRFDRRAQVPRALVDVPPLGRAGLRVAGRLHRRADLRRRTTAGGAEADDRHDSSMRWRGFAISIWGSALSSPLGRPITRDRTRSGGRSWTSTDDTAIWS